MAERKGATEKERKFAEVWARTGSQVEAYKQAYGGKSTGKGLTSNAKKVGRRPRVVALYEEWRTKLDAVAIKIAEQKHGVTIDRIMREHEKIGFSNMGEFVEVVNGQCYADLKKLTPAQWACVREVENDTIWSTAPEAIEAAEGEGVVPSGTPGKPRVAVLKTKVKLYDKHTSLDAMTKVLGGYAADNRQKGDAEAEATAAIAEQQDMDFARRMALILARSGKTLESGKRTRPVKGVSAKGAQA